MRKTFVKILDVTQKTVQNSLDAIVFVSARIVGVEIGFKELSKGRNVPLGSDINTTNIKALSEVLDIVDDINKREDERSKTIIDKAKALLPITSIAFAVLIAFRPLYSDSKLLAIPLIFILIAIILIIRLLSLRIHTLLSISQKEMEQDEEAIKKMRIRDLHNCSVHNSYSNDLLADIFRTSQTYLILGALSTCIVISIACFKKPVVDNKIQNGLEAINKSLGKLEHLNALDSLLVTTNEVAAGIDTFSTHIFKTIITTNDTIKTEIINKKKLKQNLRNANNK